MSLLRFESMHILSELFANLASKIFAVSKANFVNENQFHFSRIAPGDTYSQSLARHEHYLFGKLGLQQGMRVLGIGGGIYLARELVYYSNVYVTIVEDDLELISSGNEAARKECLDHMISFKHVSDIHKLESVFSAECFDAVYAVEAIKNLYSFSGLYSQIFPLLKSGGRVASYEWCFTEQYDPQNGHHASLAEMLGNHIPLLSHQHSSGRRTALQALQELQHCGFDLLYSEDLAERKSIALAWYSPLELALTTGCLSNNVGPIKISSITTSSQKLSTLGATALVEAGRNKLLTPMQLIVGRKK